MGSLGVSTSKTTTSFSIGYTAETPILYNVKYHFISHLRSKYFIAKLFHLPEGQISLKKAQREALSFFLELPQQFRTFAYKIEYYLPSSQKLTLLLSGPKKFQGQRRYPDLQAFGKKS